MAEQPDNEVVDPGPGVHVVAHPDPLRAARAVAEAIDGVLIDMPMVAEAVVRSRVGLPQARAAWERLTDVDALISLLPNDPGAIETDRLLFDLADDLADLAQRRSLETTTATGLQHLRNDLALLEASTRSTRHRLLREFAIELGLPEPADDWGPTATLPPSELARAAVVAERAAVDDARWSLELIDLLALTDPHHPVVLSDLELTSDSETGSAEQGDPHAATGEPASDLLGSEPEQLPTGSDPHLAESAELAAANARIDEALRLLDPQGASYPGSGADGTDDSAATVDTTEDAASEEMWPEHNPAQAGRDGSVLMPLGMLFIGLFVALVVVATHLPVAIAWVAMAVAVALAAMNRYSIKAESRSAQDDEAAKRTLTLATADTAVTMPPARRPRGSRRSSTPPEPVVVESGPSPELAAHQRRLLERQRRVRALADAEQRLADAERAWSGFGDGDPVDDAPWAAEPPPAADPALERLLEASPSLRAGLAVRDVLRQRWSTLWGQLGRVAPPPDDAILDLVLADLRETAPDPVEADMLLARVEEARQREQWRARLADLIGDDDLDRLRAEAPDADALDDSPLVLVTPFDDLSAKDRSALRRRLEELPGELTVVLVVRDSNDVPASA